MRMLLSHEANPWNNRMYDVPNKGSVSIQRRPPIHMPLNFTYENIELWREHPLILPNFIALNMYSRQSENTMCNITDPVDTCEGLVLVERGEQSTDLLVNLFKGYLSTKDHVFNR